MFKKLQDEYFQSDYSRFDLFLVAKIEKAEAEKKQLTEEVSNLKYENERLGYKAVRWDASQI